jgi:hypothetical protein
MNHTGERRYGERGREAIWKRQGRGQKEEEGRGKKEERRKE